MVLPWAMAQGAIAATTEDATWLRSTVPKSSATASNRATRRSCSTSLFIRATSVRNFSSSLFPSIVSRAEVMMASGVRSSWAALAVNSRCTAKPFASRSSAWLMEWTSGRLQRDAQAVVSLGAKILGPSAAEAEIARLIRGRRPFGYEVAKLGEGCGNDAAIGIADREQVVFGCCRICGGKLRGQFEARLARTVGDHGPPEILSAQAEFAVIQRSRRVVGLIDQNPDRDCGGGDIQHRKAHREAHLQRAKSAETHPFVSASK